MTVCVQSWSPEKERPRALAAAVQPAALLIAISHVAVLRVRYDAADARAPEPASAKIARLTDRIALGAEPTTISAKKLGTMFLLVFAVRQKLGTRRDMRKIERPEPTTRRTTITTRIF